MVLRAQGLEASYGIELLLAGCCGDLGYLCGKRQGIHMCSGFYSSFTRLLVFNYRGFYSEEQT